jgi:branched-chain amino acid aminotransferase
VTSTSYTPDLVFERQVASEAPGDSAEPLPGGTVFGSVFTDHMVTIGYRPGEQWHDAKVERFGSLTVSPAAAVLHYGKAIFEGLKAYRAPDDRVLLFRPDANAARFRQSARRLAMPEIPSELFIRAVEALVAADRQWVPPTDGGRQPRRVEPAGRPVAQPPVLQPQLHAGQAQFFQEIRDSKHRLPVLYALSGR